MSLREFLLDPTKYRSELLQLRKSGANVEGKTDVIGTIMAWVLWNTSEDVKQKLISNNYFFSDYFLTILKTPSILILLCVVFAAWFVVVTDKIEKSKEEPDMAYSQWFPQFLRKYSVAHLIFVVILPSLLFILVCPYLLLLISKLFSLYSLSLSSNITKYKAETLVEGSLESIVDRVLYKLWGDLHSSIRSASGLQESRPNSVL